MNSSCALNSPISCSASSSFCFLCAFAFSSSFSSRFCTPSEKSCGDRNSKPRTSLSETNEITFEQSEMSRNVCWYSDILSLKFCSVFEEENVRLDYIQLQSLRIPLRRSHALCSYNSRSVSISARSILCFIVLWADSLSVNNSLTLASDTKGIINLWLLSLHRTWNTALTEFKWKRLLFKAKDNPEQRV